MQVYLDTAGNQAQVEQLVALTNTSGDPWQEVVFNVSPAYWPDVFTLRRTAITKDGLSQVITPTLDLTMLHLPLAQPLLPEQEVLINLDFNIRLPELDPTGWGPTGNAGWGSGLIQMGDWYPALVPYESSVGWHTWRYVAVGDPVINELADYSVTIHAPPEVRIAAAGLANTNGTARTYYLENARSFSFLSSPTYIRFSADAAGIPVHVYVLAEHQANGQIVLDTAIQALTLFTELYGPYPYPELVIAENGFLTAMEYSALISLSNYAFVTYDQSHASLLVAVTVHEVAHQWWYGAVGNDQIEEPWLDEAMAVYSEFLYYERYFPEILDWWWSFRVGEVHPSSYVNDSIYDYDDSPTFVRNVYGKSAYFMHELRGLMGESSFRAFLHNYFQQNRHRLATGEAFFSAARAHTPADLTPLIETYFQD
jgi:hypothetical protein